MATKRKPAKVTAAPARNEAPLGGRSSPEPLRAQARGRAARATKPDNGVNENPVPPASQERHVNGIPVSSLPPHVSNMITFAMTDEGIAEANGRKVDSQGRTHSGARVLMNEGFDQAIEKRKRATEAWMGGDPLAEAADKYRTPGMRMRGLGPNVIGKKGMRGWETVKDPKTGDVVKIGHMILGQMPEEDAEIRNKHFRDQGNTEFQQAAERLQADQERIAVEARRLGMSGIEPLRAGEVVSSSDDPRHSVSIGVHSSRGPSGVDAAA